MTPDARSERLAVAVATVGHGPAAAAELREFLEVYYADLATEDLLAQRPEDLLGAALSHREVARRRRPGTAVVRASTPTVAGEGWSTGHSVVEVVTDDMRFLVDSVTAELHLQDRPVHLTVHPQLRVRRDDDGELLDVRAVDDAGSEDEGYLTESWIQVQIGHESDPAVLAALEARLHVVLADVRVAVADWQRMAERATAIAAELTDAPPVGVPADAVARGTALLEWLADGEFVFVGYREYRLVPDDGAGRDADGSPGQDTAVLAPVPGTGLGILREDRPGVPPAKATVLTGRVAQKASEPRLLIITKANSRSTVHRPQYLDYVGVKVFDDTGTVTGERRFLGLFSSSAYTASVAHVPYVAQKVERVLAASGYAPTSHLGRDLMEVLETYPRDELFATDVERLTEIALAVVHLNERPRTRLFLRHDDYGRYVSCLVYLPRDRYNTTVRHRMEDLLREAFDGSSVEHTTRVSQAVLAMVHFVVRLPRGAPPPDVDLDALERRLVEATRTWDEDLADAAREELGEERGNDLVGLYRDAFPAAYKERFPARVGVADLVRLVDLEPGELRLNLYQAAGSSAGERRLKVYLHEPISLTAILPLFHHLGVEVTDQRPYELWRGDGTVRRILDFGLRVTSEELWTRDPHVRDRFQEALEAVWRGEAESDQLGALVLRAGLDWRQVTVLRAVGGYLQQSGWPYSRSYVQEALLQHDEIATSLVVLFETRHDPARFDGAATEDRSAAERQVAAVLTEALDAVTSLDHDRILRAFADVIGATLRTSYFRHPHEPTRPLALKIAPRRLTLLPEPRPEFEIWVSGPTVSGTHLRFGKVARGGLRWSDRREDFRTEVLGLVKAQTVKNAIIVPTGAKGGFVAKQLPDPAVDRGAWLAAGEAAYRQFIGALLDVTDNRVAGSVVPPERVVRHDDDDPYLVVAADKGTAAFSDVANEIAREREFWLDDAFASGGSAGYDHKAMGITARGAWESVRRHFRELGRDTQTEDLTVVGIGDMSGDVFGNGMLLSEHIRLVAAFDHRHVFLDPEPDAATSYAERRRLFELPRSSWADYDTSLLSEGGGVHPRTAKSVELTAQVRDTLGLSEDVTALSPAELISAILRAPVDLLWNGGIGTYVKASTESHGDIGDRANDAIRVDGAQLRCRVVGEGGNLGLSQLGRVEAALAGVRINTDAIDNSAGVDSSDHEVNIKIMLTGLVRDGELTRRQRDELLVEMTDDVAAQVLRHNYEQNVLIGNARCLDTRMVGEHQRLMTALERTAGLDRALEFLPTDAQLSARARDSRGLTSPEFAVLIAYTKLSLKDELADARMVDDPWLLRSLREYFPPALRERFPVDQHPLRRQIVVNQLANAIVNRGGVTFVHRATEETGAGVAQVARAFVICREVVDAAGFLAAVESLDNRVGTDVQWRMSLELRRLLDRSARWILKNRPSGPGIEAEVDRFAPTVRQHAAELPDLVGGAERDRATREVAELRAAGVPEGLAVRAAMLRYHVSLLDAVEIAEDTGEPAVMVLAVSFAVADHLGIDRLHALVGPLPKEERWDALARSALRDDLHAVRRTLTATVLAATDPQSSADERMAAWLSQNATAVERSRRAIASIEELDRPGLAAISVALGYLRTTAVNTPV
ncbi:NAD-glutamate dehydrogenase [Georgenia sp. H159]|uniref:NAD-glutamate dehydrogenase n=1 Tax=Georgenia sp. H159 TaxID=3076115 RepID=UPI002D793B8D|nr:NAD-glutamate dehydrogenase [Georgenia sp. H159]